MMKQHMVNLTACLSTLLCAPALMAQTDRNLQLPADARKAPAVYISKDTLTLNYLGTPATLPVAANCDYTLQTAGFDDGTTPWFTARIQNNSRVIVEASYSYETTDRLATLNLLLPDGNIRPVTIRQQRNQAASSLQGDTKLTVVSASANQRESINEGIEKTYDGDLSTIYHSPYGGKTQFPVTLTYTLNTDRVDYLVYTPRQSGSNGRFGHVTILYSTQDAPDNYTEVRNMDFGQSSSPTLVTFSNPLQNVANIRFSVESGAGNYASCAEMEFFQTNQTETEECRQYFTDPLCTQLKPGITAEVMDSIANPFAKMLVACALDNSYSHEYRVATFEPYENIQTLATRLKTSTYNRYEYRPWPHASKPVPTTATKTPPDFTSSRTNP